jgi:2'-5' RNA ligase superfamily protein
MAFAVVLFFDPATEATVRRVGRGLVIPDVTPVDPFVGDLRPHVSLGVCEDLDTRRFRSDFMAFAAATPALEFTFGSLGVFSAGDEGVVFLAPIVTHGLLSIHDAFHTLFTRYAVAEMDYYLPGNWVPHCSLALHVPRDRVAAAVDASSRLAGLPLRGRFESMGLFQFQPAKDIYTAPLALGR